MPAPPRKSLFRSLGEFFGHIRAAIVSDPGKTTTVLNREVQERTGSLSADAAAGPGKVTLRRTTIDEIEIDHPPPAP